MGYSLRHRFIMLLNSKKSLVFWFIISFAFLIRVILAVTTDGYKNDLALFYYWANNIYNSGITQFYQLDIFVDYPPGYMYILYPLGALFQLASIDVNSIAYLFILKLPVIIFDLITSCFIFFVAKQHLSHEKAVGVFVLFLFNPWALVNGAVWGQVDIIFSFVLILSLFYFSKHKTVQGSILFAVAALIKPQAFIFIPILLVYLAVRKSYKQWILCISVGFSAFLLLALPFFIRLGGITSLIQLYGKTLASYPYASLNTYNAYSLFGYNWVSIAETIFTIPIGLMSYIAIALTVLIVFYYGIRLVKVGSYYYYLASLTIATVYLFVAKMHERYIFPLLLCLLLAYIYEKNKHYLYIVAGFSITTTINLLAVLNIQQTTYTIPYDFLLICCSIINIGLYIYLLVIGTKNFATKKISEKIIDVKMAAAQAEIVANLEKKYLAKLKVFSVLLLYSIVAFYQLGSFKAPITAWQSANPSEYIIFDLGDQSTVQRLATFTGPSHNGKLGISTYRDDHWEELLIIENVHTNALAHQIWDLHATTQYIMLYTIEPGYILHELAFFQEASSELALPITINQTNIEVNVNSSPYFLIDEQDKLSSTSSYMSGSYFDEIYHARTALEYQNGMAIYETTHPPLGKLLITLGIQLFGFSPFGWRVSGTVFGIVTLIIIYYFAKHLFGRNSYALAAMILFAVDFMHFTQSRISTIDIYSITFTLLMFYFMSIYSKLSFYQEKYWRTLMPLGMSGLFFGLGIATKWNGFYGGLGLALMLFIVLYQRYVEYKKSLKQISILNKKNQDTKQVRFSIRQVVPQSKYWPAIGTTILFCCLFFVIVPVLIYYVVFQISFNVSGQHATFANFVNAQKYMFSYHSSLVSTHPFASPWYEWQLMVRPIWYYVNNPLVQPGLTSTIAAFGNPIIWWVSIVTMIATVVWSLYKRHTLMAVIYIGFFSQLIPWMFVDRITFIYHFFGMVPFSILSIVYIFQQLEQRYKRVVLLRWQFIIIAILLFIFFYPVLSGQVIERSYVDNVLRWFSSWYF